MNDRTKRIVCFLIVSGIGSTQSTLAFGDASNGSSESESFSKRVEEVRDAGTANQQVINLRTEMHRVLQTDGGRASLEPTLALLLRLPAQGGRPPAEPKFPFSAEQATAYQKEYAQWTGLPLEVTNRAGITLRLIPPGAFLMGSPKEEPGHKESAWDETQHPVWITRPFYLSKDETKVTQFRQFVDEQDLETDGETNGGGHAHDDRAVWKHRPGTSWLKPGYAGPFKLDNRHPVVHVSHTDAKAFCKWLNEHARDNGDHSLTSTFYDLPTEAQWEWACRAGSGTRFWWGADDDTSGKVVNVGDRKLKEVHPKWPRTIMAMNDGHAFPAPVGSYQANGFGLHDMLGNVWEFCSTRYDSYPKQLDVDPFDLDSKRGFAVRGGGWSNEPHDARCATRNADPPHFCHSNLGFRVALQLPPRNLSRLIEPGKLSHRVHVVESYETDIEKRWWLRGEPQTANLPPSLSNSVPNRRACRATKTLTFDRKMGDLSKEIKGVVFNPVPGPPMGKRTRLSFRYFLEGTDSIKVQIYSLSNNYHRHLVLTGLPEGKWQNATVDMTDARRPDGNGGPLSEDERIDDIQFYIAPDAELLIDDILLYEAAAEDETRPFPRRVIFTGWFDTGKQGQEWPGDFEIVLHEKPLTWDAAKSVLNTKTDDPWIHVNLRGQRTLSSQTLVRFRYKIAGSDSMQVVLADSKTSTRIVESLSGLTLNKWSEATVRFELPFNEKADPITVDEIQFLVGKGTELYVDDVLIFEPGASDE